MMNHDHPTICALIPVWGRVELLRVCLDRLPSWVSSAVLVVSPEDIRFDEVLEVVKESWRVNIRICYHMNHPVGAKMNAGYREALGLNWDYIMNMGSDDIIHEDLLQHYTESLGGKLPLGIIGVDTADIVNSKTGEAFSIKYWDVPIIIGAGRLISRVLVEQLEGEVNTGERKRGLDTDSQIRIQAKTGAQIYHVPTEGMVLDIKSGLNINPFDRIKKADIQRIPLTNDYIKQRYGFDYHTL